YFDTCSRLIGRYGGTVEKFIGDAVMAVWGTPTAQEDDAERAVRASLDLAEAVAALGAELGAPELQARAGVLTGEAAATIGAAGTATSGCSWSCARRRLRSARHTWYRWSASPVSPRPALPGSSPRAATGCSADLVPSRPVPRVRRWGHGLGDAGPGPHARPHP